MSEKKVALSGLMGQAWGQLQGEVLEEIRKRVEELAEAERETRLGRGRHSRGGNALRRWGYKVRKVLMTPWGMMQGLRLPRIRDVEKRREVSFLSSERAEARLAEMLLGSTLGGMSYRKVVNWARHHLGMVISTAGVGRGVEAAAERTERGRQQRFSARQFEALVVDAVWVHYRRSARRRARSGCLLVAIGVEFGGGFRVLDWQVAGAEDAEAYLALLGRLYERGLEVLGYYHSHPDHPARPSSYDREHAWPWYSYVIVSVERGEAKALTSWVLAEDRSRFDEEPVEVLKPQASG